MNSHCEWTYDSVDNVYYLGGKIVGIYDTSYKVWIFNAYAFDDSHKEAAAEVVNDAHYKDNRKDFWWLHFDLHKQQNLTSGAREAYYLTTDQFKERLEEFVEQYER